MGLFSSSTVASLDVEVRSKGTKKATSDLDHLTKSSDKAEKSTGKLRKGITKFAGIAGAVGGLTAALAGLALVSGVFSNTAEQERVTAQLEATLKSTAGAAELNKNQLLEMASALQEVTTYGDEAIIGAENLLLTFTKIGKDVFPAALQSTLNVATAMGVDLKSAAIQVGKALNDPKEGISALSRSGITFTEQQKEVIKALVETGRVADAQKLILVELETQFGNSARAARDTMGGALKGLKNAFGDLLEGDEGSQGIEGVQGGIEDLTALLSAPSTKAAFLSLANGAITIANGMIKAAVEVGNFFGVLKFNRGEEISREILKIDRSVSTLFKKIQSNKESSLPKILLESETDLKEAVRKLQDTRKDLVIEQGRLANEFKPKAVDLITGTPGNLPDIEDTGKSKKKRKSAVDNSARDLQRLLDAQTKSAVDFRRELESLEAELDGPLAQATLNYERSLAKLTATGELGEVSARELSHAHDVLAQSYEEEVIAIEDALNPTKDLIKQLQFEVSLIGLTNSERETAITLRGLEGDATARQATEIGKLIEQIDAAKDDGKDAFAELTNAVEGFGNKATDALTDFIFGTKTSFSGLIDSMLKDIARLTIKKGIINPIVESLSGAIGGSGGDSGNGFGAFFASLFGGNRANTGPVSPGQLYRVKETGDEFFQPSVPGNIRNKESSSGDINTYITINSDGSSTSEGDQIALAKKMEAAAMTVIIREQRPGGALPS